MPRSLNRRRLLATAATGLVSAWGASGVVHAAQPAADSQFDPQRHGYGFRNWTAESQYFESPPDPTLATIVDEIQTAWRGPSADLLNLDTTQLPRRVAEALAIPLQVAIAQRAGTNGHCYGMVLTAQQYFELPDTIPVDRAVASDIEHPTVPVESPEAPVYEAINRTQADQFLRFRAWVARRAMLNPNWIDVESVLQDVKSVVSSLGTAAVVVFDDRIFGHQLLAYDYHDEGDVIRIPVYDPNLSATVYRSHRPALEFNRSDASLTMEPYGQYTQFLFNRYDRIERATGREQAGPLDHLEVDSATLRESMFPTLIVLSDASDAMLTVTGPDGEELHRLRGKFMDRTRGGHAHLRTLYGAPPGTYGIGVYGTDDTAYELTTLAVDADGVVVDDTRSGTLGPGDLHSYSLTIPEAGDGGVERTRGERFPATIVHGGAVLGGIATGAVGLHLFQRLRNETD